MRRSHTLAFAAVLAAASPSLAQWTRSQPTTKPSARFFSAMTYDPVRDVTVAFGGGSGITLSDQTWTYDGTTWTLMPTGLAPSPRAACDMVWDTARGVAVLYGGNIDAVFGGRAEGATWEWNGASWTRRFPFAGAADRTAYAMAYDEGRSVTVMYGGLTNPNSPSASNATFEYDGFTWTQIATPTNPGPRERAAMCYHAGIGRVVLFGGLDPQSGAFGDTWTFDGANWTQLAIAGPTPLPRTTARMVYDPVRQVCVMHGGHGGSGTPIPDTWEFDGSSWTMTSSGVPNNLVYGNMVMDVDRRRPVMFGGASSPFSLAPRDDTWEYGADVRDAGAGCVGSSGIPALGSADVPRLGSTFDLDLTGVPPSTTSVILSFGASNEIAAFGPLPLNLNFAGLTGCFLRVSLDISLSIPATGGRRASRSTSLRIPPCSAGASSYRRSCRTSARTRPAWS